ncbi:hypothetical protein OG2516_03483 [Oceanicola granulosus HTCC2516]|uniref:Uncharacterized protein n=1 Tax=Oceanicola granulosus (strain ATCC BAA-861 / DSM 15982 / KCTC 12143 / HTCC2516) TaxID=314256 RepID=Q2CAI9_OCEGH|nr:hypothetical protein OG2516_03483 [Oceanicola granulosus HTCC2516]
MSREAGLFEASPDQSPDIDRLTSTDAREARRARAKQITRRKRTFHEIIQVTLAGV